MPKPGLLIAGAVGAVVVIAGVVVITNNKDDSTNTSTESSSQTESTTTNLDDPSGAYNLFSDPSITKRPEDGVKFGNGQTLTFEYDGSKTEYDEYATLSYQLYYIQDNGGVIAMGGGNVEGEGGKGTYTMNNNVYNSSAKDRDGFLELQGTYQANATDTGELTAKSVVLGMYSVKFDVAE